MAKPKIKTQKSGSGQKPKGAGGRGAGGGKKEREALRGMFIGMVIIAAAAGFFMLPIGGKTTFSHLIHAMGLQGGDDAAKPKVKTPSEAKSESKPQGARATTPPTARQAAARTPTASRTATQAARPVRPAGMKIAENAARGAPLERATAADDAALERLVRQHAGN